MVIELETEWDTNSLGSVPCPSCHTHLILQKQTDSVLFLTTLLLDHLLNYLHMVTLRDPQSCVFPLYQEESYPLGSLPQRGPGSYMPGLYQVG